MPTESPPRTALIVDDEFALAEMLREWLHESGYDVALAVNGRLALDIVQNRRVDIVISDLMMPVMDGEALAASLRTSEAHKRIPIILITSLSTFVPSQEDLFDVVLQKPFTPDALLEAIDTTAGLGQDAGDRQAP